MVEPTADGVVVLDDDDNLWEIDALYCCVSLPTLKIPFSHAAL